MNFTLVILALYFVSETLCFSATDLAANGYSDTNLCLTQCFDGFTNVYYCDYKGVGYCCKTGFATPASYCVDDYLNEVYCSN